MPDRSDRRSRIQPGQTKPGKAQPSENALTWHPVGEGPLYQPITPQRRELVDSVTDKEYNRPKKLASEGWVEGEQKKELVYRRLSERYRNEIVATCPDPNRTAEYYEWVEAGRQLIAAGKSLPSREPRQTPDHSGSLLGRPVEHRQETIEHQRKLPPLPEGLTWPTETFSGSDEAKRGGGGIVAYLERVWLRLLRAAPEVVDLRTLRAVDPSAAMGVNSYTKPNRRTGKRRSLPEHLHIPVFKEKVDRAIVEAGGMKKALATNPSLAPAIAGRIRRGTKIPGF